MADNQTLDMINEVIRDLVRLGVVEFTGNHREGKPLWTVTDFGRAAAELARTGDEQATEFMLLTEVAQDAERIRPWAEALSTRIGIPWTPPDQATTTNPPPNSEGPS